MEFHTMAPLTDIRFLPLLVLLGGMRREPVEADLVAWSCRSDTRVNLELIYVGTWPWRALYIKVLV